MSFRSKTSEGISNVSIHPKGQDLIFKPKIESSNHINHLCFPLLTCLTSHTWISGGLPPSVIKPRHFYCPQGPSLVPPHYPLFVSILLFLIFCLCYTHTHTHTHWFLERQDPVSLELSICQPCGSMLPYIPKYMLRFFPKNCPSGNSYCVFKSFQNTSDHVTLLSSNA